MFNLESEEEESKRREWYKPVGEFVVLFSHLEFNLFQWIRTLTSCHAPEAVARTSGFAANVDILLNLISEYRFDHASKAESVSQWKRAKDLAKTRNLLVHNPPIENFEFLSRGGSDISAGFTVGQKVEEIIHLSLPIGEPGSGLSLEEISDKCLLLRRILSKLEALHDDIVVREL